MSDKPKNHGPVTSRELIEFVAELLGRKYHKGQIKRVIYEVVGRKVSRGTVENILRRVRVLLREQMHEDLDEHKASAIELYEQIIRDDNVPVQHKLQAQSALNDLLGLGAKFNQAGETPEEVARQAREHMQRLRDSMPVKPPPSED